MSNSFPTKHGGHVTGFVPMTAGDDGLAVPVGKDTPVGTVSLSPESVEALAKAIAAELRKGAK